MTVGSGCSKIITISLHILVQFAWTVQVMLSKKKLGIVFVTIV
jgi:hypothetical protein